MRLVLVTETFPPEVNGVARTLGRWVSAFRARGHQVAVLRPRQRGERPGPGLVYGVALPFYQQVRLGAAGPFRVRQFLAAHAPDLVHIATEGPLGWSALVVARALGIAVASSFHTNFDHYAGHYGFLGVQRLAFAYLRWFHNRTRVTLVPSRATQQRLLSDGVRRRPAWCWWASSTARRFRGWYASADVFAFPSLSETFGNVVLEAQASGLAVVGFDCQGVNERVAPEEDGLLVPVEGDLAPALARLCADRGRRERMGKAARAKAERQDWGPIFDELEARYRQLIGP